MENEGAYIFAAFFTAATVMVALLLRSLYDWRSIKTLLKRLNGQDADD